MLNGQSRGGWRKMRRRGLVSCFTLFWAILTAVSVSGLEFGSERSVFSLAGVRLWCQGDETSASSSQDLDLRLDLSRCRLFGSPLRGYFYLEVPGCVPSGEPGQPQLPMRTIRVALPSGTTVSRVEVLAGSCRELAGKVRIAPNPQPAVWRAGSPYRGELIADEKVYSQDLFLPEKVVSFDSGSDRDRSFVHVRVFPALYNPKRNRVVVIERVRLRLCYASEKGGAHRGPGPLSDARDLIVAPLEFSSAAESLRVFHESVLGVTSEVVSTAWIEANYPEAPDPPHYGYANQQPPELGLYDYSLAKKIISCLRDTLTYPNLEVVTILGDGIHVPPSYYARPMNLGGVYESFVPTDFLYSSPDYDYYPDLKVGRLTANDSGQAQHMVDKATAWCNSLDWSWFQHATIGGGRPFGTEFYYGEMITDDAINLGWFDDMVRGKCFYTDGTFDRAHFLPSLRDGQVGILYHIGHGSGDAMHLSWDYITSSELLGFSPVSEVPVVISVACDNGAFDTHIIGGGYLSFGEGVLLSPAAGIAYIGGSRTNAGVPTFYYDEGEVVITLEQYMVGMLTDVLEAYRTTAGSIGDLYSEAIRLFLDDHSMSDPMNQRTFFEFVLLGDPNLPIPGPLPGTNHFKPDMSALNPLYFDPNSLPHYEQHLLVEANAATNSPSVTHKLIDTDRDQVVEVLLDPGPPFDYQFYPDFTSFYLVRSSAEDGKEGWLYLVTDRYRMPAPPILEDPGDTVEVGDYLVVWHPSTGPHGIASYELQESVDYRLKFSDDLEDTMADNWNLNGFLVSNARWHSSSHSLYSGMGNNLNHTATTVVPLEVPSQAVLSFWLWYDIEQDWDYGYAEISADGTNWYILDTYTGTDTSWAERVYDLGSWAGDSVYLRFRYETDVWIYNEGMYVDDVAIQGGAWATLSNSITDTTFQIAGRPEGTYFYRVRAQDDSSYWGGWSNVEDITVELVGVAEDSRTRIPASFAVFQSFPNPFSHSTTITYHLTGGPGDASTYQRRVNLSIYDAVGRRIRTLIDESQEPGCYSAIWDGKDSGGRKLPAGVYFYRLRATSSGDKSVPRTKDGCAGVLTGARKLVVLE